ncbi:MAG: TolC family protein [Bacteroidota bacterium]|nr:TolC family protein [Bacteroidota bacterium]
MATGTAQIETNNSTLITDSLTMEQAVRIALDHQPLLRSAEAAMQSTSSSVTQAQSSYFPVLNLTASGTRTGGAFVFNPSFPARTQFYNNYSTGATLQQTIYDFGRTGGRVSASEELYDASALDYTSTRDNAIMNVELAYITFVQAKRLVDVNEEAVKQAEDHLKEAQAFYKVGSRPEFDVTKAEVDVANANVNFIHARNQVSIAKVQLENAMGVHPTHVYAVQNNFETTPFAMPLDSAKEIALRSSTVLAAEARVRANQELASTAWNQNLPSLMFNGSYTWNGFDYNKLLSRWNGGITLSVPVFQGFNVEAQVQQAEANTNAAQASLDLLKESVRLDVEQNYLSLNEAGERIGASQKLVTQAEQNLKLAEGRYNSGVGSPIEITDAQVSLSNARITYIQALADYNSSLIRLRKAMGVIGK